jgi:flavin-dependent dehydrogenase
MEVAVVGAGPAGALCAARLARAGHAVTVFDPSHPREKPCGGGVTPGALDRHPELAALRALGRAAGAVRLRGPGGEELRLTLPRPVLVFERAELDGALLEAARAAGARLARERVHGVSRVPGGVELATGTRARAFDFAVGADGAASVVRRRLAPGPRRGLSGYATAGFHVEGLAERDLYVEFFPDLRGYLWVFPRRARASVGIAAPLGRLGGASLRERVLETLARRYPESLALARTPYAAAIPGPLVRRPPLGGPRFALVGDAAALTDSITGEGIAHALDSAALLAQSLCAHGPRAAARAYAERWRRGPGRELAIAARWARRWYRPASVGFFLRLARAHAFAARVMADCLAAEQPYATLGRRALREALARTERAPARV